MPRRKLSIVFGVLLLLALASSVTARDELKIQREANELFSQGVAEYEKENYEAAIKKFEECLAKDPTNAHAEFNIGVIYNDLGETDKALDAYRKVLALDPHYADAYFNVGRIMHLRKDFAAAAENYEKAMAESEGRYAPDVLFNYAHALMESGRVNEAVDAWHRYITIAEPIPEEAKWVERAKEYVKTLEGLQGEKPDVPEPQPEKGK